VLSCAILFFRYFEFQIDLKKLNFSGDVLIESFEKYQLNYPEVSFILSDDSNIFKNASLLSKLVIVWQSEYPIDDEIFIYEIKTQIYNIWIEINKTNPVIIKYGDKIKANTFLYNEHTNPTISLRKNYGFIVCWQSLSQDGDLAGIFGQMFNSSGLKNGSEFQINVLTKGDQKFPRVAMNAQGQIMVIWVSKNFNNSGISLNYQLYYVQRTEMKFRNFKTEITIKNFTAFKQINTHVKILDLEYSFVVVWIDEIINCEIFNTRQFVIKKLFSINMKNCTDVYIQGLQGDEYIIIIWRNTIDGNIYGQIFNLYGIALNNYFILNEINDNVSRLNPILKGMNNSSFLVVWIAKSQNITNICGRYFKNYTVGESEFILNERTYNSITNLSFDGDSESGEILLVWVAEISESGKNYSIIVGNWWVFFESMLKKKTGDFFIYNSTHLLNTYPSIAVSRFSPYISIIVWCDIQNHDSGENVYAQMIDNFGYKIGRCFQVNAFDKLNQISPSVTITDTFIFLVWSSFLQDSDGFGIFGAVYDLMGNSMLKEFQINTEYINDQVLPSIDSVGSGDIVIVWYSANSLSIKAQKIIPDYQAELSTEDTLGFELLNKFSEDSSICAVLSDDGVYAIIAVANGYIQIVNLVYLYVIENKRITEYEILMMHKSDDFVYIGIGSPVGDILILNCTDFAQPYLVNSSSNITFGNVSSIMIFVKTYQSLLYLCYEHTICVFNITNQTYPILLAEWLPFGRIETTKNYVVDCSLERYILIIVDSNNVISTIDTEGFQFKNLSSFQNEVLTYATLLSSDRHYLFVGTKSGLEIYLNKNFTYSLTGLVSLSRFIGQLHISKDGRFLSLTSSFGHYLFSLSNPVNPQLLNFLLVINKLSSTLMTHNNTYVLMCAKGGTLIQKIITMNNFATPYLVFCGFQYIPNVSSLPIELSSSSDFIYGINENGLPLVFMIDNISDSSSALLIADKIGQDPPFLFYAFDKSGLKIYEVVNNIQFTLKGSLDLKYNDYLISSDKNFVYVGVFENFSNFIVINTTDYMNPRIISSLVLNNFEIYANLTFANKDESQIYVTLELYGIVQINVSNKNTPIIINSWTLPNLDLNLILKLKEDIYIITNYERFYVYNMSSNQMNLCSDMITSGNKIVGMQTLDESYLFIITSDNLTLIDIHNISHPMILDTIKLQSNLAKNTKSITSSKKGCIYIAFVQVFCLFGSLTNYLYADMSINPNSQTIQIIISFWPVNLISGYTIKLIKFSNINTALNWISLDCENFQMIVNPASYWDLQSILQPLEAIYATKIQTQELNSEEINFLKLAGYLDNDYFITDKFNTSQGIAVDNPNISSEKIKFILGKHYKQRKYYFETQRFLNLIPPSVISHKIQDQVNKVTGNGGLIISDSEFSFYLSSSTSKNHYQTLMEYSALNLPNWLDFDSKSLRFSGTPGINDTKDYNITVSVFNGYHTTTDSFMLQVRYYPPILNPDLKIQSQMRENPQVEIESQTFISKNCFIDPNNGTLTYTATLNNQLLPQWIQFDGQNLLLRMNPIAETFQKTYTIQITAKNKHYEVSDSLNFLVETSWKYTLTIMIQIIGPLVTLIGLIKYRTAFYNVFFKKYFQYPPENIYVDIYFEKEIYFIKDDLEKGMHFWKRLKKNKRFKVLEKLDIELNDFKETLSKELKKVYHELNNFENEIIDLLDPGCTIFVICECFWYHRLLKRYNFTFKVYQKMKVILKKEFFNSWYRELVKFCYYLEKDRDLKSQKFPPMEINKENVDKYLQLSLKSEKLEKGRDKINLPLIYGILKADALGIPKKARKWFRRLEYSRGESCFMNLFEIQEIRAQRKSSNKTFLMEIFNNEKLPYWIKYKIKYGILTFYGTPPIHDQGTFNILLDSSGIIVRSQFFNILPTRSNEIIRTINIDKTGEMGFQTRDSKDFNFDEKACINKVL